MGADIADQVAIVTGGNRGYGKGIAGSLKDCGVDVWITGRDEAKLEAAAQDLGVHAVRADVTSPTDWDALMKDVLATAGRLDILINNAGAGVRIAPLHEQSDEEIDESIAVNLTGAVYGCRRAAGVMKGQGSGTIINVASVCATQAWGGFSVYSAAKAGMLQLSRCLYAELRQFGVRVTTVIPSWGATDFREAVGMDPRPEEEERLCIQPAELGELVTSICALPPHLEMQEVTLWPLTQEVEPL